MTPGWRLMVQHRCHHAFPNVDLISLSPTPTQPYLSTPHLHFCLSRYLSLLLCLCTCLQLHPLYIFLRCLSSPERAACSTSLTRLSSMSLDQPSQGTPVSYSITLVEILRMLMTSIPIECLLLYICHDRLGSKPNVLLCSLCLRMAHCIAMRTDYVQCL
jgi:hypothetical protein